jgi:hypothetical protein
LPTQLDAPPVPAIEALANSTDGAAHTETPAPLALKRPQLVRPISRPQPPTPTAATPIATKAIATNPLPVRTEPAPVEKISPPAATSPDLADLRQRPISPPSEPKQYRAIGLVRGQYTPSEEQFTRGSMVTAEGTTVEAVLLGRVMSLVKNHLDLQQNHLWVVYPRTRETEPDLHLQIVGVWEPEKLNKEELENSSESSSTTDAPADISAADSSQTQTSTTTESQVPDSTSAGYDDDYFSIRGEVVFYSEEKQSIAVKIQQAPRKTTDKAKAFKLQLRGTLPTDKALGYFWSFDVQRRASELVITSSEAIGLVPPRRKSKDEQQRSFRPKGRSTMGRSARPDARSSPTAAPTPVRREPMPKPTKRKEQSSQS